MLRTDDAHHSVWAADRPDAGGRHRQLPSRSRSSATGFGVASRRRRSRDRVTGDGRNMYQAVVPDQERLVEVRSQVAIQPHSSPAGRPASPSRPSERPPPRIASQHPKSTTHPPPTRPPLPWLRSARSRRGSRGTRDCRSGRQPLTTARHRPYPASFVRSGASISRCCGLARRWLCRGSGGGSSTTISFAGRRRRSSCGISPVDSSMSSNGRWCGTTRRAARADRGSATARGGGDSIFFSRRAGTAVSEPVGPQEERGIRRCASPARARRSTPSSAAPLYTQAGWVVVPFQFKAGPKQPGVTCISSF